MKQTIRTTDGKDTEVECCLCGKDIGAYGVPKYLTIFSIQVEGIEKPLLCRECAKIDQEITFMHYKKSKDTEKALNKAVTPLKRSLNKFHKLVGNIYIKI